MTQVLGHEWVTPVGRAIGWPSSYRSPGKSFTVPFTTVCSGRYLASRGLGRQQVRGLTPISPPPGSGGSSPGPAAGGKTPTSNSPNWHQMSLPTTEKLYPSGRTELLHQMHRRRHTRTLEARNI